MKKIFEIPVYAFSRRMLCKKEGLFRRELWKGHETCSKEHMDALVALVTYPFRLWDYNHIVGYIRISTDGCDILFDIFLPTPQRERYRWRSGRKVFLYDISANGTHFYVNGKMTNTDIQERVAEMLQAAIKTHVPQKYFADTEAFDNLNRQLDYRKIMRGASNGQDEI